MTIAYRADTGIQTMQDGPSSDTASLGTSVAGNLIVVGTSTYDADVTSITDTLTDTFVQAAGDAGPRGGSVRAELWYAEGIGGGTNTVQVNLSAAEFMVWSAAEFSGIATTASLDKFATSVLLNSATDANVSTGITTSQADELVIGVAAVGITGDSDIAWGAAATTGYTNFGQFPNFSDICTGSFDWKIVSAAGIQTANWSHDPCNTDAQNGWIGIIATFLGEAAAGALNVVGHGLTQSRFLNSRSLVH